MLGCAKARAQSACVTSRPRRRSSGYPATTTSTRPVQRLVFRWWRQAHSQHLMCMCACVRVGVQDCIDTWLAKNANCPTCRSSIRTEKPRCPKRSGSLSRVAPINTADAIASAPTTDIEAAAGNAAPTSGPSAEQIESETESLVLAAQPVAPAARPEADTPTRPEAETPTRPEAETPNNDINVIPPVNVRPRRRRRRNRNSAAQPEAETSNNDTVVPLANVRPRRRRRRNRNSRHRHAAEGSRTDEADPNGASH